MVGAHRWNGRVLVDWRPSGGGCGVHKRHAGTVVRSCLAGNDGICTLFLWHSLKGGVDVAWRAFHPRLPITSKLVEYPLRLPPGLPRVILVNTVSLLPGTLSAELGSQVLKVHVLDSLGDFLAELEALEQRVGCRFRSASDDFPRR